MELPCLCALLILSIVVALIHCHVTNHAFKFDNKMIV